MSEVSSNILRGKKVLVTAGPTREFIDAVRFISNPSSGKMGLAMAHGAKELGAEVTFVHGNISVRVPQNEFNEVVKITSAADLFDAVTSRYASHDVIIMAAAVSDFTPLNQVNHKIKKTDTSEQIMLKPTRDILKWLGEHRKSHQTLIGFAMETDNLEAETERKRASKNADWICGNLLNGKESGFEVDTNTILLKGRARQHMLTGSKRQVAIDILRFIFT